MDRSLRRARRLAAALAVSLCVVPVGLVGCGGGGGNPPPTPDHLPFDGSRSYRVPGVTGLGFDNADITVNLTDLGNRAATPDGVECRLISTDGRLPTGAMTVTGLTANRVVGTVGSTGGTLDVILDLTPTGDNLTLTLSRSGTSVQRAGSLLRTQGTLPFQGERRFVLNKLLRPDARQEDEATLELLVRNTAAGTATPNSVTVTATASDGSLTGANFAVSFLDDNYLEGVYNGGRWLLRLGDEVGEVIDAAVVPTAGETEPFGGEAYLFPDVIGNWFLETGRDTAGGDDYTSPPQLFHLASPGGFQIATIAADYLGEVTDSPVIYEGHYLLTRSLDGTFDQWQADLQIPGNFGPTPTFRATGRFVRGPAGLEVSIDSLVDEFGANHQPVDLGLLQTFVCRRLDTDGEAAHRLTDYAPASLFGQWQAQTVTGEPSTLFEGQLFQAGVTYDLQADGTLAVAPTPLPVPDGLTGHWGAVPLPDGSFLLELAWNWTEGGLERFALAHVEVGPGPTDWTQWHGATYDMLAGEYGDGQDIVVARP